MGGKKKGKKNDDWEDEADVIVAASKTEEPAAATTREITRLDKLFAEAIQRGKQTSAEYDRATDADRREVITLQTLEEAIVAARRAAVEPWRVTEAEVRWQAERRDAEARDAAARARRKRLAELDLARAQSTRRRPAGQRADLVGGAHGLEP